MMVYNNTMNKKKNHPTNYLCYKNIHNDYKWTNEFLIHLIGKAEKEANTETRGVVNPEQQQSPEKAKAEG